MFPLPGPLVDGSPVPVRPADDADAVDGVRPRSVLLPETRRGVAAALGWAAEHRLTVVLRGRGTKSDWGARPRSIDVLLDVSNLDRVIDHEAGDLTVTVEAGARLRDLNGRLSAAGQWLPLDPPFGDGASIGGLLATNDSGPLRHRYGTPRDLVIGVELATADGQLAKAGGRVVKNVAGYDLSKLVSGSFGTLAAVVSATFKLLPIPTASSTIVLEGLSIDGVTAVCDAMARGQLEPAAFEVALAAGPQQPADISSLLRFASFPQVVEAETANALGRLTGIHPSARVVTGAEETALWRQHAERSWAPGAAVVRVSWRPADVAPALRELAGLAARWRIDVAGRLAIGAGLLRIDGADGEALGTLVAALRQSRTLGNVVVRRAPAELKDPAWVWGAPAAAAVATAIKRAMDPHGVLGAGRGPVLS